jgi:hypothetical protein
VPVYPLVTDPYASLTPPELATFGVGPSYAPIGSDDDNDDVIVFSFPQCVMDMCSTCGGRGGQELIYVWVVKPFLWRFELIYLSIYVCLIIMLIST